MFRHLLGGETLERAWGLVGDVVIVVIEVGIEGARSGAAPAVLAW